ncbi:uncharacterized protein C8R40DRAFT_1116064 [Lentinula edodes]|uniref:uncharacterized protein n=1 Tax=Lentinula edodes TaxID=5353 RepID=UPI001E8E6B9A|nr:uncharacterized protein C8R40DRAFT_1116064 [Lentinula edodes]KAH7872878.1 hypothetical protein C8R40DRAFT_1116064 [Lentinula edodes]
MAFSSEYERARYSQQLAEHTLRQFSAARVSPDSTARLPPSQSHKLARLLGKPTSSSTSPCRNTRGVSEPSCRAVKA